MTLVELIQQGDDEGLLFLDQADQAIPADDEYGGTGGGDLVAAFTGLSGVNE